MNVLVTVDLYIYSYNNKNLRQLRLIRGDALWYLGRYHEKWQTTINMNINSAHFSEFVLNYSTRCVDIARVFMLRLSKGVSKECCNG